MSLYNKKNITSIVFCKRLALVTKLKTIFSQNSHQTRILGLKIICARETIRKKVGNQPQLLPKIPPKRVPIFLTNDSNDFNLC